jgi:molybdopterin-guanine dinucleotide biosynthesis protein A
MAAWSIDALEPWTARQVAITGQPEVAEALGVPGHPDRLPGLGPIGGLHAGLTLAKEDGRDGIFLLACDLPLVTSTLIGRILSAWPPDMAAVVPGSPGPLGFEPLCAGYSVRGLEELEDAIRAGRRSMEDALSRLGGHRVPVTALGSPDEVELAFTNVNTKDAAHRVEGVLADRMTPRGESGKVRDESYRLGGERT